MHYRLHSGSSACNLITSMQQPFEKDVPARRILIVAGQKTEHDRSALRWPKTEFTDCAEAATPRQAFEAIMRLRPHVVLIDMPTVETHWVSLIKRIKESGMSVKVLAACGEDDPTLANRVLQAGADGYVLRHEGVEEVASAVQDVLAGGLYVSEDVLEGYSKGRRTGRLKFPARPNIKSFRKSLTWARSEAKAPVGAH
jgi:DNA-binding NarL/FixJ family response regulator